MNRRIDTVLRTLNRVVFVPFLCCCLLPAFSPVYGPETALAGCAFDEACLPPRQNCAYGGVGTVGYASGHQIRRLIVHDFSACTIVAPGLTQPITFNCFLDLELSDNGGGSWSSYANVPATCSMVFQWNGVGGGGEDIYATSATQLDGGGGGGGGGLPLIIRESPVLNSTGQSSVKLVGNSYAIESFFDVFTEISLDGGINWLPGNGSCRETLGPAGAIATEASTWGAVKDTYR